MGERDAVVEALEVVHFLGRLCVVRRFSLNVAEPLDSNSVPFGRGTDCNHVIERLD